MGSLHLLIHALKPCCQLLDQICNSISCQPNELERCSNPLHIQQVFSFRLKKKFFVLGLGFSLGGIISGSVFAFSAEFTWPWVPTQWAIFLLKFIFGNKVKICIFRALDWVSSITGTKILWLKNTIFNKNKKVTQKV